MDMTRDINLLLAYGREEVLRHFSVDSCIASTRVAVNVMERLGYAAHPMSVSCTVFNPAMTQKMEETGSWPKDAAEFDQWIADLGAWNVSLGLRPPGYHGFVCHLVAIINRHVLVDLSLDQATRSAKNMILHPFASVVPPAFLEGMPFITRQDGMLIIYKQTPETGWKLSPNWVNRWQYEPVVEAVYQKVMQGRVSYSDT